MKKRCILIGAALAFILAACGQPAGEQSAAASSSQDVESSVVLAPEPSPSPSPTPSPVPSEPASSQALFTVSELYVTRDGLSIYGKLYTPATQEDTYPAVILSHSANITSDSLQSYCEKFASLGFVAYAFDFCGGSTNSRSDGSTLDMTVFTEVADLEAVLTTVQELDFVDSQNIFLFGTSQGGLVSALAAAERPSEVSGLILFYPGFNIAETAQKFNSFTQGALDTPFTSTLTGFDVYEHIVAYEGDVLIVHGTKDFIVPYSYSEKAAALYKNCELHLIEGATHGFNQDNYSIFGDYDEEAWTYVEGFLAAHSKLE